LFEKCGLFGRHFGPSFRGRDFPVRRDIHVPSGIYRFLLDNTCQQMDDSCLLRARRGQSQREGAYNELQEQHFTRGCETVNGGNGGGTAEEVDDG
jgi:hypothetical protein